MSVLDFIFGGNDTSGKQKTKTATSTEETGEKFIGQDQVQGSSTRSDTEATTQNRTTAAQGGHLFTPAEQAAMDALIGRAAGTNNIYTPATQAAVGGEGDVANMLRGKLGTFGSDLDQQIAGAKASAEQDYREKTMPQIQHYADLVGSSGNSTVQLMRLQGERDLQTALTGVEEDWRLKAGDQYNQLGAVAADAGTRFATGQAGYDAGGSAAIKSAVDALTAAKGGSYTATSDTMATGAASTQSLEDKLIQAILAERDQTTTTSDTNTTQKGTSSGSSSGSLPGLLGPLGTLLGSFGGTSRGPIA